MVRHYLLLGLLLLTPVLQAFTVSNYAYTNTSNRQRETQISQYKSLVTATAIETATVSLSMTRAKPTTTTSLRMSDSGGGGGSTEKSKKTKKGLTTIVIDKTETKADQKEKIEEQWRVVLHNDEVHTFNYVIQSLCKVIGTLDRKRAFDICVLTHGSGKATITKTWKEQAMKYCLGLQRQGLTASIAPESRFSGDGDGDGGGEGGGPDSGKA